MMKPNNVFWCTDFYTHFIAIAFSFLTLCVFIRFSILYSKRQFYFKSRNLIDMRKDYPVEQSLYNSKGILYTLMDGGVFAVYSHFV